MSEEDHGLWHSMGHRLDGIGLSITHASAAITHQKINMSIGYAPSFPSNFRIPASKRAVAII
jgi:hypothetical protein